ncbi:MAG: hypothetical protein Unbinned8622contig1005_17 [Prokaryotic dsDNA virus sp.]|nr:MAG: hypothetical protein Unbinned8622contig1005_17 [Prokaryotic dsDNA virus sp.]|tara:strand:+ start:9156 stop:10484 length:1329 start_codon:yes stop_codon:yes gene_type:complete
MATNPQLAPYEPGLVDTATNSIAEGLLGLGLYKNNPYRAYRMAENLSGLLDFVPIVGDVKGGAETADAAAEGNYGEAAVTGLLTALGAIPGVGDVAAGALKSMFVSPARVATFKHTLGDADDYAKAQELEEKGVTPSEIYNQTAFFRGADGQWRTELPDNEAQFTQRAYDAIRDTFSDTNRSMPRVREPITDMYRHDRLFETLPDLEMLDLSFEDLRKEDMAGYYSEGDGLLNIVRDPDEPYVVPFIGVGTRSPDMLDDMASTTVHELQHAVQDLQGLNRGAGNNANQKARDAFWNEKRWLRDHDQSDDLFPALVGREQLDPYDLASRRIQSVGKLPDYRNYLLSAGESEAFLTEAMRFKNAKGLYEMGLPAARRGNSAPYAMQHVYGRTYDPQRGIVDLSETGSRFLNQDPEGYLKFEGPDGEPALLGIIERLTESWEKKQ